MQGAKLPTVHAIDFATRYLLAVILSHCLTVWHGTNLPTVHATDFATSCYCTAEKYTHSDPEAAQHAGVGVHLLFEKAWSDLNMDNLVGVV